MKNSLSKRNKTPFILLSIAGAAGICSFLLFFQFWLFLMLPGDAARGAVELEVPQGANAMAISKLLHSRGVISNAEMFYLVSRARRVSHRLKAGEYAFPSPSTPGDVLERLIQGRVVLHKATFPEGSTVRDVAKIIEEKGFASEAEIERLSHDKEFIRSLGLSFSSLEGYLFPETYHFQKRADGPTVLKSMVQQFWSHFPQAWRSRAEELGLSVHEIVTMASLVEKEAVLDSERPVIAAVFFNRLKKNMPLESDPTAVYDLPGFSGPITPAHLKNKSPYNTYVIRGLPAGPICNPGAKSIEAALYPAQAAFLYFVSNNDGAHQFSETLAEHNRAVNEYREARKAAREKETASPEAPMTHFQPMPPAPEGNEQSPM